MHRGIPTANKFLSQKWRDKADQIHRENLLRTKSRLDSTRPISYKHLKKNQKKFRIEEEKLTEIQRENRILYQKMFKIFKKQPIRRSLSVKKSLNTPIRKKWLKEISAQNYNLLNRLTNSKSHYQMQKFKKDRKELEKRAKNLCEFPYVLGKKQSIRSITPKLTTSKQFKKIQTPPIVYCRSISLNGKFCILQIKRAESLIVFQAFDVQSIQTSKLELNFSLVRKHMNTSLDFDSLLPMLDFQNDKLIFTPKKKQLTKLLQMSNPQKSCPLLDPSIGPVSQLDHFTSQCICFMCTCNQHLCPAIRRPINLSSNYRSQYRVSFPSHKTPPPPKQRVYTSYKPLRQQLNGQTISQTQFIDYKILPKPTEKEEKLKSPVKMIARSSYQKEYQNWGPSHPVHQKRPLHPQHATSLKIRPQTTYTDSFPCRTPSLERIKKVKDGLKISMGVKDTFQTTSQSSFKKPDYFLNLPVKIAGRTHFQEFCSQRMFQTSQKLATEVYSKPAQDPHRIRKFYK